MEASTEVAPAPDPEPRKPQRRTWNVEIIYKGGSVDRETVKAFTVDEAVRLDTEGHGAGPLYVVDGEQARITASVHEVMRIRVS